MLNWLLGKMVAHPFSARFAVCDPKSLLFLFGMQLDYSDALIGGGFSFQNPNASQTCGCGKSFAAEMWNYMYKDSWIDSNSHPLHVLEHTNCICILSFNDLIFLASFIPSFPSFRRKYLSYAFNYLADGKRL